MQTAKRFVTGFTLGCGMEFELWLFAVKQLAQTYEMSQVIYQQLPAEEKTALNREYRIQILGEKPEEAASKAKSVAERVFTPGEIVKSLRYETLSPMEKSRNKEVFQIVGECERADSGEKMMVYQELFGEFSLLVLPLSTFQNQFR